MSTGQPHERCNTLRKAIRTHLVVLFSPIDLNVSRVLQDPAEGLALVQTALGPVVDRPAVGQLGADEGDIHQRAKVRAAEDEWSFAWHVVSAHDEDTPEKVRGAALADEAHEGVHGAESCALGGFCTVMAASAGNMVASRSRRLSCTVGLRERNVRRYRPWAHARCGLLVRTMRHLGITAATASSPRRKKGRCP